GAVAVLAHGGLARCVRRSPGGVVGERCARVLADRSAPGRVPCPRRRACGDARRGALAMLGGMRSVVVDKLASVTQACGLSHEVRIAADIPAEHGGVLGVALNFPYLGERIGVPARVGHNRLDADAALDTRGVPVVALAGTCMEAGKTAAACAVITRMRHRGLTVDAFKATGVSLRRDILAMEDAGARRCAIFTDL